MTLENLDRLISRVPQLGVLEQFDATLELVCERCPSVGQPSSFNYIEDWPEVSTENSDTALYILWQLAHAGLLEKRPNEPPIPPRPTWKGYERLQQLKSAGKQSQVAFVAMSFDRDQEAVFKDVIEPAIKKAGYQSIRVDRYEHTNRIDDEIIAQLRRCRFVVADFTGQRNGVYFEAGFAQGLGRNVIWMCKESEKGLLHFDTRQYNHIFYDDFDAARRALTNRIIALEGEGSGLF